MLSLAIPLVLAVGCGVALRRAVDSYRAGMTGDALWNFAVFALCSMLAAFYLLGYEVALWLS